MKQIRVQIEGIDDEGRGRGSYCDASGHEFDVAVRGAFPTDDVTVQVERVFSARQLIVGRAIAFFKQGNCHVKRQCPHLGPCPACPLHGTQHSLAIDIKRARIERALRDQDLNFEIDDLVLHPKEMGYRQKVKLMAQAKEGRLRLGVYIPYSHDFVVAEQCPYVRSEINSAIVSLLRKLNESALLSDLVCVKAILLRSAQDGVAAVIVTKQELSQNTFNILDALVTNGILVSVTERVQKSETNSILSGEITRRAGPRFVIPLEGGPSVDPDSFCQSDPEQATFMYDVVAEFLTRQSSSGLFIDAYAGVGGFTRALLRCNAREIIAIEQSESALATLSQLGAKVEVILKPMSEALQQIGKRKPIVGLVVDPPKKGLMQDAQPIAALGAERLVLVSCDPDAMAKDLGVFIRNGYAVERILPVDFFGGTVAIETIVMMTRLSIEPQRP